MIAKQQIRKPENWQDFELLCKKLWGEIWECSDTIQRNGRAGQTQQGVDIYGYIKSQNAYYGIQCKGKDEYTNSQLTEEEIDNEIAKAKTFEPKLKRLIFATTANKDAKIEAYIRSKNVEHIAKGEFEVYLSSWEDIVDLLEERRNTYNWYINNCQYKDSTDVEVTIEGKTEYTIHPQYYRTTLKYEYCPPNPFEIWVDSSISQHHETDYRWATVFIQVENIGSTAITDYKLYLNFEEDGLDDTSDMISYPNPIMSGTNYISILERIDRIREVFTYNDSKDLYIVPTENTLVQTDSRNFKIGIKPKDGVSEIIMNWDFKSRDYNKQGTIVIKVEPEYEDRVQIVKVDKFADMHQDEINIEPKIVRDND